MVAIEPRFCHQCGAELIERAYDGRPRRYCEGCERFFFKNAVPGVDVFVRRDGEFLLLREPGEGGRWVIPGGHPEYDEEPADAAVRELEEETGLGAAAADLRILSAIHSTYRGRHYNNICYLLEFADSDGELAPGVEAAELQFWTPAAIRTSDRTRGIDKERLSLVTDD